MAIRPAVGPPGAIDDDTLGAEEEATEKATPAAEDAGGGPTPLPAPPPEGAGES